MKRTILRILCVIIIVMITGLMAYAFLVTFSYVKQGSDIVTENEADEADEINPVTQSGTAADDVQEEPEIREDTNEPEIDVEEGEFERLMRSIAEKTKQD